MSCLQIHGVLEILFLSLLGVDLILKGVWFGSIHFVKHKRSVLIVSLTTCRDKLFQVTFPQTIVLMVMYVEALTVLIRQENHIRITRLLRPLFFIDTHYMLGVRRYSCVRMLFAVCGKHMVWFNRRFNITAYGPDKP